jgi:hypothetical protein
MINSLTLHILFLGVAFFQILFIFIQWIFFKRNEYLFYIAYIASVILFILFRINETNNHQYLLLPEKLRRISYQPLGIFSYWMYLCFAIKFLNLEIVNSQLYKYMKLVEKSLIIFILFCVILIPFEINKSLLSKLYLTGYSILLVLSIPIFLLLLRQKYILHYFLIFGCLLYVLGGTIGMLFNFMINSFNGTDLRVFYGIEIGILGELLLLNTGFMLKNRILDQQVSKGQIKLLREQMEIKDKKVYT